MPSTAKRVHVWFFKDRWFWDYTSEVSTGCNPAINGTLHSTLEELHGAHSTQGFLIAFGPPDRYKGRHALRYASPDD